MRVGLHPDVVDWLVQGDRAAVLTGDRLVVLSPLATAILQDAVDGTDLVRISRLLAARFGSPPSTDLDSGTEEAVLDLVAQRILMLDNP